MTTGRKIPLRLSNVFVTPLWAPATQTFAHAESNSHLTAS